MYFHGGYSEVILFDFWRISTLAGLVGSMIGCFLMGILYEGIKSSRERESSDSMSEQGSVKVIETKMVSLPHFVLTA